MNEQRYASVKRFARTFDLGRTKAYELVRTGRVRSVRVDGRILIPVEALDEFAASLELEGVAGE